MVATSISPHIPQARSDARGSAIDVALASRVTSYLQGTAVPGNHPFQEGDNILGKVFKERLPLRCGRTPGVANVTGLATFLGDPALRGRLERHRRPYRLDLTQIANQPRR